MGSDLIRGTFASVKYPSKICEKAHRSACVALTKDQLLLQYFSVEEGERHPGAQEGYCKTPELSCT